MSQSAGEAATQRSWSNVAAFLFGVPLGAAVLIAVYLGPHNTDLFRYVSHPVECVEVLLFFCALTALVTKGLAHWGERSAARRELLPVWDGKPVPASDAARLRACLTGLGPAARGSLLGRRVSAILDFVVGRRSANQLDDQMRMLSDNDALAAEGSYSLIRLIIWAIPILGFLGTVLGITEAIFGVTPEVLEKSLDQVTGGLATAFDATALALGLTMTLMFVNFLVERLENGTLQMVDQYVDAQLAHRFERGGGGEGGDVVGALRQNTDALRQAWAEAGAKLHERVGHALDAALERTLASHAQRLVEVERQMIERNKAILDGVTALTAALRDTGREHRSALAAVAERLAAQAETLARIQTGEAQLIRLQEALQQNLASLAGAGSFEQAVESLTGAIHLLTARVGGTPPLRRSA